jgi:hypothetical protein
MAEISYRRHRFVAAFSAVKLFGYRDRMIRPGSLISTIAIRISVTSAALMRSHNRLGTAARWAESLVQWSALQSERRHYL